MKTLLSPPYLMVKAIFLLSAVTCAGVVVAVEKPLCDIEVCFATQEDKDNYAQTNNCRFPICHLATGADVFRWAIGKQEAGGYGYTGNGDSNPCTAANNFCAAKTAAPSSAGDDRSRVASYGAHQITLLMLLDWMRPGGKARFESTPPCLEDKFLNTPEKKDAMKAALEQGKYIHSLVLDNKVPAATYNADGTITYPDVPADIQSELTKKGVDTSQNKWTEQWQRMSVWANTRKIITETTVTEKTRSKAWSKLKKGENKEYMAMLDRLKMTNNSNYYTGVGPYVTGKAWAEAAHGFANNVMLDNMSDSQASDMLSFFGDTNCYADTVDQMFDLKKAGHEEKKHDPTKAETVKWVARAASKWNTGGYGASDGHYAKEVLKNYKSLYKTHYGKTNVCR